MQEAAKANAPWTGNFSIRAFRGVTQFSVLNDYSLGAFTYRQAYRHCRNASTTRWYFIRYIFARNFLTTDAPII